MKIAIFGGTFNPIHKEHINIVKSAIEKLALDKVIVMPSYATPKKNGKMLASCTDRLNMCRLAFSSVPKVTVSDYEISKKEISYSYITCREFKKRNPSDDRYFIIGGDMLENFPEWKMPEEILKCVNLAVCAREDTQKLVNSENRFKAHFNKNIVKFDFIGENLSSTKIRTLIALNENFTEFVDRNTEKYILQSTMYRINGAKTVKSMLSTKRWQHTVRVALMAAQNCGRLDLSEKSAITSALFHDCAKELPLNDNRLKDFKLYGDMPETVFHQFSGAYLAEHYFGVKDPEIINAVRYHTTGRENMSPLEKLIFLCDMLEAGRSYSGVEELRKVFEEDIDKALFAALERQVKHLNKKNQKIYYLTQNALDYLKEDKYDK